MFDLEKVNFYKWFYCDEKTTDCDRELYHKACGFEDLFNDMLLAPGYIGDLVAFQNVDEDGEIEEFEFFRPEELEGCDAQSFAFKVSDDLPPNVKGLFEHEAQRITIARSEKDNDSVLLHELIHAYQYALNSVPYFFAESLTWSLYYKLKKRIPKLDEVIQYCIHAIDGFRIFYAGGEHNMLFLLKSFDLDIRMNYHLGTVFGYGRLPVFEKWGYTYE